MLKEIEDGNLESTSENKKDFNLGGKRMFN